MTRSGVLAVLAVAVGLGCGEMPPVNDGGSSTGGGRTDAGSGGGRTGGGSADGGTNTGGGGGGEVGGGEGGGAGGGGTTTECTPDATRACCTTGMQTCDGSGRWGACSITGTIEVCNGVDDDCDGQVDENIAFTPGELADAGALPDGGCEVGVGACLRNGGLTCNASGAAACNVTAGTPGTESCNGVDDDCDGQVDEGMRVACLPDEDNDGYATSSNSSQQCPDSTRPTFGNCPVGFVASSASPSLDCAPQDSTKFKDAQVRADADNDGACAAGAAMTVCVGALPAGGLREATSCSNTDDCNDADANAQSNVSVRTDADNDTYCVGGTTMICGAIPSGSRSAATCNLNNDCDDTSNARYRNLSVRNDADNDGYCSSTAAFMQCTGATPQPGTRLANDCYSGTDCDESNNTKFRLVTMYPDADADLHCVDTPTPQCVGAVAVLPGFRSDDLCVDRTDCADNDVNVWRMAALRRDQDNDGYCGSTLITNMCIGSNAPSGYRLSCPATLDCRDTNPNATTSCTQTAYSNQQTKTCNATTPATQPFNFTYSCPTGFIATSGSVERLFSNCLDGSCTCPGAMCPGNASVGSVGFTNQDVSFICEFAAVGFDNWRLNVTCTAQ